MIEFASDWNAFWTLTEWFIIAFALIVAGIAWVAYKIMEWWDL